MAVLRLRNLIPESRQRRRQEDLIVNSIPILLVGLAGGILTSLQIWLRPYSDLFFVFLGVIEICVQSAAIGCN